MRAARTIIAALGLGLLSSSASAQAQPPVSSYKVNVVLNASDGTALYKGELKCDPLKWCATEPQNITIDGRQRIFSLRLRWNDLNQLKYTVVFNIAFKEGESRPFDFSSNDGQLPLRNREKAEEPLYSSWNGISWKGRPEFEKGSIAKLKFEVRT